MFIGCIFLVIFSDLRKGADGEIENLFIKIRGELHPDTNIVIIHFTEDDIASIGPWPIKRNYYALLINQLTKLRVKKIGLEVFLSSRLVTQSVYDNLLLNEIEKSGKVVLSSIAGNIIENQNKFITDSLSYPSPKLLNEDLITGHINFIENHQIDIPLILWNFKTDEKSFASQLTGKPIHKEYITVNFISSWEKFETYSALQFAELVYTQSNELKKLENKIVIIGISDKQISSVIHTPFDEQMPGVALHAFAVDNILNSRDVNGDYYNLSVLALLLIVFLFAYFRSSIDQHIILTYFFTGIFYLVISFILNAFLYWKISNSSFLIPFITLIITDIVLYIIHRKEELMVALDETTALRSLLFSKETELNNLQKDLKISGTESSQLLAKIDSLQNDIKRLKGSEEDKSEAEFKVSSKVENFFNIIYSSRQLAQVVELIKKAAPTDTTILLTGESGTGKELAAKAIHSLSNRKDNNFVTLNCAALPDNLLESELFGYQRGAFTGAVADKQGKFELADGGTIFLDEIGETTENFQVKMLRVLQSGDIEKVGSTKSHNVNVRVVAATYKNLSELVKEKKFREDLYYRLNVINIELPPLRERREDINAIAHHLFQMEAPGLNISVSALQALNDYNWKGNVRELESVIKRAAIFVKSENRNMIQLTDLPNEIIKEVSYSFDEIVIESLRSKKFSHSSIAETAKELGNINRTVISENLRGVAFRTLVECGFDIEKAILNISGIDDPETNERVRNKLQTFISNIENDIKKTDEQDFATLKKKFASKYKNLPVKFHTYLDKAIQNASEHKL